MNREEQALVSVVTTFYNAQKFLDRCIKSVLSQTYPNIEHILIDDGSTDSYRNSLVELNDERVKLFEAKRIGRVAALNLGVEKAKGKYIAILDADDISYPDRVNQQVLFLEQFQDISLVYSNVDLADDRGNVFSKTSYPQEQEQMEAFLMRLSPFSHSSVMFRKKDFLDVGGYNMKCSKSIDFNFYLSLLLAEKRVHGLEQCLSKIYFHDSTWGRGDKEALQMKFAIFGLINFFCVKSGRGSLFLGDNWSDVWRNYDLWFKERGYQEQATAKKIFNQCRQYLREGKVLSSVSSFFRALHCDPWFWKSRGIRFNYPNDVEAFLEILGDENEQ